MSRSSFRFAPVAQKVLYICGLPFSLPIREEHFSLLSIKVGKGGEFIVGLKPTICEDFRPGPKDLVLDLKLLQEALSLKRSLE